MSPQETFGHPALIKRRLSSPASRAVVGSLIGTTIEWYDFYLYGTAAALVFNHLFFPNTNPTAGLLAAFATYAVGFGARPVGALLAGHLGDRFGRKSVLVASLLLMGFATVLIGVLPTYSQVGLLAPVVLVVIRLLQGLAVGGEWGGAALIAVEHAGPRRRGLYGSFTQIGSSAGMLLASGGFATVQALTGDETFDTWGWRLPFLASAVLIAVGLAIRVKLDDAEVFVRAKQENALARWPLVEVLRTHQKNLWLTAGMRLSQIGAYVLYTTFGLSYVGQHFGNGSNVGLVAILIASAIGLVSTPLWAVLSDRIGRKPVYLFGAVGSAAFLGVFFAAVGTRSPVLVVMAIVIGINVFHDAMYGPQAAWFTELFGTRVRYSGASIGYQFGSVVGGGLTPLIATALLLAADGSPLLILAYFVVLSVPTVLSTYWAADTYRLTGLDGDSDRALVAVAGKAD
jgi:MFS transporter, MHS family, shikimate and dehydroshikimate transport protein